MKPLTKPFASALMYRDRDRDERQRPRQREHRDKNQKRDLDRDRDFSRNEEQVETSQGLLRKKEPGIDVFAIWSSVGASHQREVQL